MSAPDRPTREQADALLWSIEHGVGGEELDGRDARRLAYEVRALRAELAAVTPRPAEEIEQRFTHLATLAPGWDSYGAEKVDPATIVTARSVLTALTARVHICPTPEGGIQLAWDDEHVTLEINPGDRLSASVGELYAEPEVVARTPQPTERQEVVHLCPTGQADLTPCCGRSVMEMALAGVRERITNDPELATCPSPLPAVPDGEDAPSFCDCTDDCGGVAVDPTCPIAQAKQRAGDDVPARLDAAAEALEALHSHGLGYELRQVADQLRDGDGGTPELRAAVAAALALPTEREQ